MAVQARPSPEPAGGRSATRPDWAVLALLLLALIAAAPLWAGPGLVNTRSGGDSPFLFIRLHQLVENLRAGVFPARWMPDAAYGLGYPFFNFYAALPYYFAAVFNLIGFDLLASIKIVQSLGFVFAAWAMYGWLKSAMGHATRNRKMAWLAAAAYTFAPFHLVNVYVRGDSLGEFYAFVFFPLILWTIDRVIARPGARSISLLALAYGGLILTHNVSAMIFSPFVLLYMVFRGWKSRLRHSAFHILQSALGILLGLLISAWYWLPALGEAPLVQLDVQTTGYFNYNEHFRSGNLVQASIGFDYDTEPPHTPFTMGLAQAFATLAGVGALIVTRRGSTGFRIFILFGLSIATVMITPLSKPLWDSLPLLPLTQFPWRFLSIQALFASLAIGYLGSPRTVPTFVGTPPLVAVTIGLALAASTWLPLRPDFLPIRADEITPERIQLYEAFTTNIGTTIRAEYLPRTTIPRPYTGPALIEPNAPPRAIPVRGAAAAQQTAKGAISQSWSVRADDDATLAFPTLYFPGWRAAIDDQPVEARAAADLGYIEVDVPAGEHTLTLWLDRTSLRAGAEIVSLVAALGLLGMLSGKRPRPAKTFVMRMRYFVSTRRYEIGLLVSACALATIASAANAVEARDNDLTMDFESKPWLHHDALNFGSVDFTRYRYTEARGDQPPLVIDLWWSDYDPTDPEVTARVVAPSWHVFGAPEPLASLTRRMSDGPTFPLAFSARQARGMYLVEIEVVDASHARRTTFLHPLFLKSIARESAPTRWAQIGDALELRAVTVKHDRPEHLKIGFDWAALKPIAANYALSLRLQDEAGRAWVTLDTQPGYGFLPTSTWLPGENQHDVYTLALPADMPRDATYALDVVWYRVESQQEIGRVRVPGIEVDALYGETNVPPPPRSFEVPPMQHRVDVTFGNMIRLLGYDRSQSGNQLSLTLHWQALADMGTDYKFFVHVFDPATERIAAQVDAMPGGNAYPTSRWVKGEIVSENVELELELGRYRVATGWYDPADADRLPALDAQGHSLSSDRAMLGGEIIVP